MTTRDERLEADGYEGDPVLFYRPRDPNGWASNFARYAVVMLNPFTGRMTRYRTGEFRYQALKAKDAKGHDYVLGAANSGEAQNRGREVDLRDGWGDSYGDLCWYAMAELVIAKTIQHDDIRRYLTATHARAIYEDSPVDDIWGWRYHFDYRGKNLLGRCWMYARSVLV